MSETVTLKLDREQAEHLFRRCTESTNAPKINGYSCEDCRAIGTALRAALDGEEAEERVEYRVTWKRVGQQRKRKTYQTLRGATDFMRDVLTDECDEATERWDDATVERMTAPFTEAPRLEVRPVGAWTDLPDSEETE